MRLVAALLFAFTCVVQAQDYPVKNVRIIAPAAPGGNPDVLGRMLAARLSDIFGKPFVVENVPGAGGVVAAELLAHAAPDGHMILMGDSGNLAINPVLQPKLGYNPMRDFAFITTLAALPTILVAPPSLPAKSLSEFVALAKAKPGSLSYGSAGQGSIHHLTMAVFTSRAGVDMLHVPYKGGSAMVTAVLAGEVQAGWSGIPNVLPHIRAGRLKAYAISTPRHSASIPEVPTAAEQGFPGFDIATVIGLQARAGTPPEVIARIQSAVAKIVREPLFAERMTALGMELMEDGTENDVRFVKEDMERYAAAVKTAGIRVEQ